MSLHDDLVSCAKYLLRHNSGKPSEADIRRSISTAYYALFHRLIEAVVTKVVSAPAQQAVFARMFDHGWMKALCQRINELAKKSKPPDGGDKLFPTFALVGWPVPNELQRLAVAFTEPQEQRHQADYNRAFGATAQIAKTAIGQVETAFADLATVEATPAGQAFLLLLLVGEPKTR